MNKRQQIRLYNQQLDTYERTVRPWILRALQSQTDAVINWLQNNPYGYPPIDALIRNDAFVQPLTRLYTYVGELAARREFIMQRNIERGEKLYTPIHQTKQTVLQFFANLWRDVFRRYAINEAYRVSNRLSETSKQRVREALQEGYEQGLNNDKLATKIKRKLKGEINRNRAVTIARTETGTAANMGKEQGARDYFRSTNQGGYKEYVSRRDEKTRTAHRNLNGTTIPVDGKFTMTDEKGSEQCDRPLDTALSGRFRINCRCTLLFISERMYNRQNSGGGSILDLIPLED